MRINLGIFFYKILLCLYGGGQINEIIWQFNFAFLIKKEKRKTIMIKKNTFNTLVRNIFCNDECLLNI